MKSVKYAVVTGCASGIGKCIADFLHENGIVVFGLDIEDTKAEYETFICDVSEEEHVKIVLDKIKEKTKSINYLVNAAGVLTIGKPLRIVDMPISQWEAITRINLKSMVLMIKYIYPFMKELNDASIVNLSSEQVYNPDVYFSPYSISKAGVNMLTVCAAKEFLSDKIRVNAIALGTVKTNILKCMTEDTQLEKEMYELKNKAIPFGLIDLDNVCGIVDFLLSQKSRFITGEIVRCDGGYFLRN